MNKKEQIITALAELSRTRGVYRVTINELAAQAGVSKRTIYRYFRSKDEIIEAMLESFLNQMLAEVKRISTNTAKPADILLKIINLITQHGRFFLNSLVLDDLMRYYPDLWSKFERFRTENIRRYVFRGIAEKRGDSGLRDINVNILETAFLAAIQAVVNPEFILTNNLTLEDTIKQLIEIFMYGIVDGTT